MAEDPKITPSAPPWEPVDVPIHPDGPPWEPVDVPIDPDGPPWNPIEVPLYPSPPPWEAVQVPTYPDGPPWEPQDVNVQPSPPPWPPQDVQVDPAGPPWEPEDVDVQPPPPPWPPQDVTTLPSGPPWEPQDVQVDPSGPPWEPEDVPIHPSGPGPLSEVIPVRDHRTPPPYEPVPLRSSRELADRLRRYDQKLADFIDTVGEAVPFVSSPGRGAFDPLVLADWLRNLKESIGVGGMAKFIAEQSALYAMNPTVARVFDPTYFAKLAVPGLAGNFNTHLDSFDGSYDEIVRRSDESLRALVEADPGIGYRDNTFDPINTSTVRQDFTVDEMVEARTNDVLPLAHPYMREDRETGVARFDANRYFEAQDSFGGQKIRGDVKTRLASGQGPDVGSSKLARSAAIHGIVRLPVPTEGEPVPGGTVSYGGAVLSETTVPHLVDDDDVRLPLYFTDLRKDPSSDAYRSVFFQPMNLVINETFSPSYDESQAFGRVDPTVGYMGTSRTWSVSFEVHAFAPEDLRVMYEKMTWLTSMVYPSYGPDALMRSGPVCRMRIGDLASTSEGGVPGVIRSLNFDFAECLWELQRGMKVPRSFGVQLDYLVLHDGPVGLLDGMFGVLTLPGASSTTNMARAFGRDVPSQEQQLTNASLAPGRWAKFGSPAKKGG